MKHDDILLEIGQSRELNIRLDVGQIEEVVNVTGTAAVLDRSSPSIGTVIGSSQLKQLPLAGRHWATLMMLSPGAINTGEGTHLSIRFVGRARDDNNWTFDGVDATGVKDPRQDSTARLIISTESISEFRVSASLYSAESGAAAGGQVQLISKTGTNQFHGSVYNFIRNDAFDARPFGSTSALPPFRLNHVLNPPAVGRNAKDQQPVPPALRDDSNVHDLCANPNAVLHIDVVRTIDAGHGLDCPAVGCEAHQRSLDRDLVRPQDQASRRVGCVQPDGRIVSVLADGVRVPHWNDDAGRHWRRLRRRRGTAHSQDD